jgi:cell division septal protein FtsQ
MSRFNSNITSSLNKKRKKIFIRKLILLGFLLFFLFVTCIFIVRSSALKIKTISIVGNTTVSQDEILGVINLDIQKEYFWIIPTDNFFLLRRNDIQNHLLKDIPNIQLAQVSFSGLHTLVISVSERQQASVWCGGNPDFFDNCYAMDANGFIFETATSSLSTSTLTYFGLITDKNPIGETYFSGHFIETSAFYHQLMSLNIYPESFSISNDGTGNIYTVNLWYGGKMIADDTKVFAQDITDMKAVITNGYVKTDIKSLQKINYIDLRYGDKVVLKFN